MPIFGYHIKKSKIVIVKSQGQNKRLPLLNLCLPVPAPPTALTVKVVYVVSYSWHGLTSAPMCICIPTIFSALATFFESPTIPCIFKAPRLMVTVFEFHFDL